MGATPIGSTPCYKGQESNVTTSTHLSSNKIFIPKTIEEDGMCKIISLSNSPIDEKYFSENLNIEHRIQIKQTQDWPYRVHGHMIMRFPGEKPYTGSGILVGPNHVLTAGHNLYNPNAPVGKRWATEIFFSPGRDQDHYPYGDFKGCILLVHEQWEKNDKKKDDYDFGMVILDSSIGNITGWSGLLSLPDSLIKEWGVSVTGYPGEKGVGNYYSTQMWGMDSGFGQKTQHAWRI